MSDEEEILPCVMCNEHHEQMLMLSCIHDPCINCAATHYCTNQPPNSNVYICVKCGQRTQLDSTSIVELQRVYHVLKGRKKYDYRKNFGAINTHSHTQNYSHSNQYPKKVGSKKKVQQDHYNPPTYTSPVSQPYTPVSQPSYSSNPHNNILVKKTQQPAYMCEEHPQEQLSYFCFTCSNPICPECAIHGTHRNHEVQTTRKAIKQIKSNLGECGQNVMSEMTLMKNVREGYKNQLREIGQENKRQRESIRHQLNSLMMLLGQKQKQYTKTIDSHSENNAAVVRGCIGQSQKVIEQYQFAKKNIDSTMKKDDLTILQQYSRRQRDTQKLIQNNKDKTHMSDQQGLKQIDYAVFKDQIDQLTGIIQALRLTVRSKRN